MVKAITGAIADGLSNVDATAVSGISEKSFYDWLKRGEAEAQRRAAGEQARVDENPFLQFLQSIKKAVPKRKRKHLCNIARASRRTWQASAWLLERQHPDEFGQRARLEHSGPDGGPIPFADLDAIRQKRWAGAAAAIAAAKDE